MKQESSIPIYIITKRTMGVELIVSQATDEDLHEKIIHAIVDAGSSRNIKVYKEHNIKLPELD